MKKLKPYRVTKNSSDGTFYKGEIIWKSENGDINSVQGKGCITPSEVDSNTLDFECEEETDYEVIRAGGYELCRPIPEHNRLFRA